MRYCFAVVILAAVAAVATGCDQIRANPTPATNTELETSEETKATQDATTHDEPLLLDDEPLLLDDEPLLLDDEPLLLDDEPLLLDDEPLLLDNGPNASSSGGPVADNSRCYVCHINYMQEELAVVHARDNIGCADCHGNCDAHIADESWSWGENGTPPGIMYPQAKINSFCMGCHPKDKMPAKQHEALFAATAEKKYCTDCHGQHRLAHRKCKWK